jgi:hypothetical protein
MKQKQEEIKLIKFFQTRREKKKKKMTEKDRKMHRNSIIFT